MWNLYINYNYIIIFQGFDDDGTARLYQTDPSGTYAEWKANAIGRNAKTVREFLEKNYDKEKVVSKDETVKLAIKVFMRYEGNSFKMQWQNFQALLEVVQSGGKNLEICVMEANAKSRMLEVAEIEAFVAVVEKEKEEEAAQKKKEKTGDKK